MKIFKAATTVCCVALMGAALTTIARADDYDRKTVFTFSGPVEIPAVHLKGLGVLPAGTYVFKIVDSQSDRHIVQIFSADEKTVYATILAIPNYRLKVTGKTVITFRERPAGEPQALRAWFYPGRNWGEEFVYPKARAIEIARSTNTAVLSTPAELPLEVSEPIKTVDEPAVAQLRAGARRGDPADRRGSGTRAGGDAATGGTADSLSRSPRHGEQSAADRVVGTDGPERGLRARCIRKTFSVN